MFIFDLENPISGVYFKRNQNNNIFTHRNTCREYCKGIEMKSSQGPAKKKTVELIVVFLCHRALYHCYKRWIGQTNSPRKAIYRYC